MGHDAIGWDVVRNEAHAAAEFFGQTECIENAWDEVEVPHQRFGFGTWKTCRITNGQWHANFFVVEICFVGKPVVVFAQRLAVVGGKNYEAVVVDLMRFEPIEQAPKFVVEVADLFVVAIFVKARRALAINDLVVGDLAQAFLVGSESRHDALALFALEGSFESVGRGIGAVRILIMNPQEIAVLLGALIFEPGDGGVRRRVSRALEVAFAEPTALAHFIVEVREALADADFGVASVRSPKCPIRNDRRARNCAVSKHFGQGSNCGGHELAVPTRNAKFIGKPARKQATQRRVRVGSRSIGTVKDNGILRKRVEVRADGSLVAIHPQPVRA